MSGFRLHSQIRVHSLKFGNFILTLCTWKKSQEENKLEARGWQFPQGGSDFQFKETIKSDYNKFLVMTNLTHFFTYLFVSSVYILRASQCSSSGDRIVLIHHLVWLVCVSDCLVCRSGGKCSPILTGISSSHLHRLIIPNDVLTRFDLMMMSAVTLETYRDMK